jgi:hypothetical protein
VIVGNSVQMMKYNAIADNMENTYVTFWKPQFFPFDYQVGQDDQFLCITDEKRRETILAVNKDTLAWTTDNPACLKYKNYLGSSAQISWKTDTDAVMCIREGDYGNKYKITTDKKGDILHKELVASVALITGDIRPMIVDPFTFECAFVMVQLIPDARIPLLSLMLWYSDSTTFSDFSVLDFNLIRNGKTILPFKGKNGENFLLVDGYQVIEQFQYWSDGSIVPRRAIGTPRSLLMGASLLNTAYYLIRYSQELSEIIQVDPTILDSFSKGFLHQGCEALFSCQNINVIGVLCNDTVHRWNPISNTTTTIGLSWKPYDWAIDVTENVLYVFVKETFQLMSVNLMESHPRPYAVSVFENTTMIQLPYMKMCASSGILYIAIDQLVLVYDRHLNLKTRAFVELPGLPEFSEVCTSSMYDGRYVFHAAGTFVLMLDTMELDQNPSHALDYKASTYLPDVQNVITGAGEDLSNSLKFFNIYNGRILIVDVTPYTSAWFWQCIIVLGCHVFMIISAIVIGCCLDLCKKKYAYKKLRKMAKNLQTLSEQYEPTMPQLTAGTYHKKLFKNAT